VDRDRSPGTLPRTRQAFGLIPSRTPGAARVVDYFALEPFVVATFVALALFPLTVVWATSFGWVVLAFVVGGLREVGEPAPRAPVVGLYYMTRSLAIALAAVVGGLLQYASPAVPFYVAAAVGAVGVVVFALTVDEAHAA
jgi:hypothetical protein